MTQVKGDDVIAVIDARRDEVRTTRLKKVFFIQHQLLKR